MKIATANILCKITNDFYRNNVASFAATRKSPWTGWQQCAKLLEEATFTRTNKHPQDEGKCLSVLDLACGNLRFETFLSDALSDTKLTIYAVDNCGDLVFQSAATLKGSTKCLDQTALQVNSHPASGLASRLAPGLTPELTSGLAPEGIPEASLKVTSHAAPEGIPKITSKVVSQTPLIHYQNLDILNAINQDSCLNSQLAAPPCDFSVSFGFMHHIPLPAWRSDFLTALVQHTKPGGYVIVSFWQFLNDKDRAAKARAAHQKNRVQLESQELDLSDLNSGDFLLGWENLPGRYRYCHSFSEQEIDTLARTVANRALIVSRFIADGKTNNLNSYLVLRVN